MEPNRTMNLALVSFASVVLGVSVSLFLSDLYFSKQLFPYIFENIRVIVVFIESFFAYLIGFLLIVTHNEKLDTITKKKILNLLLIAGILILMSLIGVRGFSPRYSNISSFTLIVFAFIYCTINPEKFHLKPRYLVIVMSLFFVFAFFVMNSHCNTNLKDVRITGCEQSGDSIHLDIEIVFCQEEAHTMNILFEMILPEGVVEKNAEYIKIVDFPEKGDTSLLDWCVILPNKNEEYTLYLLVWSELEKKQYKIEIPRDVKEGDSIPSRELTFLEYLKIPYLKLKRILKP